MTSKYHHFSLSFYCQTIEQGVYICFPYSDSLLTLSAHFYILSTTADAFLSAHTHTFPSPLSPLG